MSATAVTQQEQDGAVAESEEAYAIETQIKAAMADGREALWRLAEALNAFDEIRGWLKLDHDNLSSWLADADVTLTRGTYYRLVRTWRKLVVERHVDVDRVRLLDQSKVAIVVDRITEGKVPVDDAFADVESLGASDLREKYYGPKPEKAELVEPANTPSDSSGHKPDDEPVGESGSGAEPNDGETVEAEDGDEPADNQGDTEQVVGSEEPAPEDDPEFEAIESLDDDLAGIAETQEPSDGEALLPAEQAMFDAESLPWDEIQAAVKSGAAFPRMPRDAFAALLQWHKTHLS